jgi:hypothetical protein
MPRSKHAKRRTILARPGARACDVLIETIEPRIMMTAAATTPEFYPDYVRKAPVSLDGGGTVAAAGSTSASAVGGLTVAQVRGAYGVGAGTTSTITFSGLNGTVVGDGSGQIIAVVDAYNDPNIAADLATFDAGFKLPAPASFTVVGQTGSTTSLPANGPTSGNNDWSGEESLDVEWAHAIAPGAGILVVECTSNSGNYLEEGDAIAAAYPGVSVVSNSYGGGESSGETSLDQYFTTPSGHAGVSFFASTGDSGAEVEYPAQSPNVVAVGGTDLTVSNTSYSSEAAWSDSGGGTSAYETRPSFQTGTISSSKRETPDISIAGGQNSGNSESYVPIVDSYDQSATSAWTGVEGTSWSSPMIAAMVAIANQGRVSEGLGTLNTSSGVNQVDTRLYQLSTANFHDITSGSNGHTATTGYDEASGIGSPIGNVLIPDLAGAATITGRDFIDYTGTGVYGGTDTPVAGQVVYLDLNNDGKQDNSEPTATTNAMGIYTFTDQVAGGSVRLNSAAPAGYTLTSTPATISYGATDTANFVYTTITKVSFAQQPVASAAVGATISPIVVDVQIASGATATSDSSTVTLALNHGTFGTGVSTATAVAVNGVATFSGLNIGAVGTYSLIATDGTLTGSTSTSVTITQATPTVTWSTPASITYGTALGATQLDATANVPGTFSYTPATGTILTAGSAKALSVVFTPTDTTDYTTASGSTMITVSKATPTVSWSAPASIIYGTALGSAQLDATANVAGTLSYTPATGTILTAGSAKALSVVFTPTDTSDYATAGGSTTITVLKATPTVSWSAPASITYGTALDSAQLDAAATVPGTFSYTPPTGSIPTAGSGKTLSVVFTPTDTSDYATAGGSTTITVLKATPTITWSSPTPITSGTALGGTQLDASADVAGSFAYSPPAGTVLNPGPNQMLNATFTPTDSMDYATATTSVSISVTAPQPINLSGSALYIERDAANSALLDIWENSTPTGTPAVSTPFAGVSSITLSAYSTGAYITADFSNGNVDPSGGMTINTSGAASGNTLVVVGTGGNDTVTVPGTGVFNLNSQTISYAAGTMGNVYFQSPGSGESLTVPAGIVTLAPSTTGAIATEAFGNITIGAAAELAVPMAATPAQRVLLQTGTLSIASSAGSFTGTLDLADNDMDISGSSLGDVNSEVTQGLFAGSGGIISTAAQNDRTHLTTLGVIQNSPDGTAANRLFGSNTAAGLFDNANPAAGDVLVRYTWFGDANLDGQVDGSDYSQLDAGYASGGELTGWVNGDFNYDGAVDGTDYSLIDNAYNNQGASVPAAQTAAAAAVVASNIVSSAGASAPIAGSPRRIDPAPVAAAVFNGGQTLESSANTLDDLLKKARRMASKFVV